MRSTLGVLALVSLFLAPLAGADDRAGAFIEKGLQLRRDHRDADALEQFRRAHEVDPSPRTLAQIALAEQAIGSWVDAEHDLMAALAEKEDRWILDHSDTLKRALDVVRKHLASVEVKANVDGGELWLNGAKVGRLPMPALRVPAGRLRFEVRLENYDTVSRTIELSPGAAIAEEVDLVPVEGEKQSAPVQAVSPARSSSRDNGGLQRTVAWGALGAAGALLGGALAAQAVREQNVARYNDDSRCLIPPLSRNERCGSYLGSADTAARLANIGYIGAGALTVAAAVLFVTLPRSASRSPTIWIDTDLRGLNVGWRGDL
jgi:hypothetical protein